MTRILNLASLSVRFRKICYTTFYLEYAPSNFCSQAVFTVCTVYNEHLAYRVPLEMTNKFILRGISAVCGITKFQANNEFPP